jgi:uncharacterized protein YqeY
MSLKQRIAEDMKSAMRAGNTRRRDALRLLQAALKQREVDERIELDDAAVVAVIEKMLKQRKDSIIQYEAAQRLDLAEIEKFEIDVLRIYMPTALSDAELSVAVDEVIASVGGVTPQKMGQVMALLKTRLSGQADMAKVSTLVKSKITN